MNLRTRVISALVVLSTSAALTGCGSSDDDKTSAPKSETLTVYAAASLTGVFTDLGKKFEADHPGVKVTFSFGGSSDLVTQIQQGAPADVFASADTKNMDKLTADGLQGDAPENFASNTLEIVTPPDNPAKIDSLDDLAKKGVALVICAPEVPCGSAAQKVEEGAKLTFKPVSEEQSVKDVLAKVTSGEADAGLVYVTDVKAAGDAVNGVTFPEAASAVNTYPIATLKDSKHAALAKAFVELVLGTVGQEALAGAGFAKP
ncbi:molybdate ABC transporter substrate-binding protein [Nocardioides marmorisolisilvae]|uniref:Molybdate ABC transporter substrate-binding protein n=1 Tax=Nocardioides marmorisolisilvae TaxID=1542737 RepID=A0A3N0DYY2_9ACTN|nr:molybdate ABC transporter substrate-binding protein [Nocardioides marmorisolisilvae]RNL80819.1 molybdate ABC transporter substrate-binding protein [Nocardioides marmorisolisilvae]